MIWQKEALFLALYDGGGFRPPRGAGGSRDALPTRSIGIPLETWNNPFFKLFSLDRERRRPAAERKQKNYLVRLTSLPCCQSP
jgi:hypothetical protein